jgi:hypothetical protein
MNAFIDVILKNLCFAFWDALQIIRLKKPNET